MGRNWLELNAKPACKSQLDYIKDLRFKQVSFFQVLGEVQESVKTGLWAGDCFIYTNGVNRLNYYVGGEIVTISHLDR